MARKKRKIDIGSKVIILWPSRYNLHGQIGIVKDINREDTQNKYIGVRIPGHQYGGDLGGILQDDEAEEGRYIHKRHLRLI